MSTEALNKIIKEVNALTPQDRRELIDRLTHEKQITQEQIVRRPAALPSLDTHEEDSPTLHEWLTEARNMRAALPLTSDSVAILRELREVRSEGEANDKHKNRTGRDRYHYGDLSKRYDLQTGD